MLNADPAELENLMLKTNYLNMIYVIDSQQDKSAQMTEQIIKPLLNELKGYFKLYVFDC